jgi:hypothetical protein
MIGASTLICVARLLVAEQVSGSADVEIVARELEAGAKTVELGQNLQALLRSFRDRPRRGHCKVGIGARLRTADPASKLVELREAEAVGTIDDQRVRAWDVEATLDDRGREENVVLAVVKGAHPLLDLARAHLPVSRDRLHLGYLRSKPFLDVRQVGDARHDEEALATPEMLAQQGFAKNDTVEWSDVGAYREAVDRWGLDHGKLAKAAHCHLQRSRDGRRR